MLSEELLAALAEGATVVTPTRRLARWVSARHDAAALAAGQGAWQPADVLPWQSWLRRTWLRLRDWGRLDGDIRLLRGTQSQILWRRVLADLPPLRGAVLAADAAGTCRRSWALAQDWDLTPARIAAEGGEDAKLFAEAAAAYAETCRAGAWLDPDALPARLAAADADALVEALPRRVAFVGVELSPPSRRRLTERMRAAGVAVDSIATAASRRVSDPVRVACDDADGELHAAAAWARTRLEADPGASIGLVLAQPEDRMDAVADILDDVLSPGRILPDRAGAAARWNLYLDRPLDEWPLAGTALRALSFLHEGAPLTEVGLLLRSPWLAGGVEEMGARARLDVWLRRRGYFELSPELLLGALGDAHDSPSCPILRAGLERCAELRARGPRGGGADAWARHFSELLAALGWPGRRLDSGEYQSFRRWREALVEFGGLDGLLGRLDARGALAELGRLAREIRFQPETEAAPVEVTGLLDAAGMGFDACWVTGLHDGVLPRPLTPDPLIPAGLQRRLGMPRADAASEREFAARTLAALSACAGEVVFSWPTREDDRELRPSPLLATFPSAPAAGSEPPRYAEILQASGRLECLDDFHLGPGAADVGGTDLLQQQAACPFRAQAVYRLGAEPVETPRPGVDRRTAGSLAHRALERLWGRWRDQAGLPAQAEALAEVEAELAGLLRRLPPGQRRGRERLLEIELERLPRLIGELLEVERDRPPFRVEEREAERKTAIGPLELAIRIDRIDRLGDGRLMVIDYKSGAAGIGDWLHERPPAPQLPVYALALGEDVAAVAVGSLKAGAVGYLGLGSADDLAPGIVAVGRHRAALRLVGDWDGLMRLWRDWLAALASEHRSGAAAVRPRTPEACRYCHLTVLCRRHELASREIAPDEA